MGKYTVKNKKTGETKSIEWAGDTPPTQQDVEQFFQEKKEPTAGDVLSQPGAQARKGFSQLASNPIAGLANIGSGIMGAIALPFSLADIGMRNLGAGGKFAAEGIEGVFGTIAGGVKAGENLIQKGVDALGVPKNVQNLGMSPEKAQEASEAVSGFNQGAAQFILGAGAAKIKKAVAPPLAKTLAGEKVQVGDPTTIDPVVAKVQSALKEAKPIRSQTEALYTKERGRRIARAEDALSEKGGEKGHFKAKAQLAGELPKVEFEPLRDKVTQADIDYLHNAVASSDKLTSFEKIGAGDALNKLFTQDGMAVPQEGQIALLERVFGSEFAADIMKKRGKWNNIKRNIVDAANLPKTLMASFDMSMPLRQTVIQVASHPIKTLGSWGEMHKSFFSEKAFRQVFDDIHSRPNSPLYEKFKLDIINPKEIAGSMVKREEMFMSRLAEKVPIVGQVVKASSRAAHTMLNKSRADLFDMHVKEFQKLGLTPEKNAGEFQALSHWLNITTGRGSLGTFSRHMPSLNAVLFSPRLLAARFETLNPATYFKLPPEARKIAIKDMVKFVSSGSALLGAAKMGGADVELDPRSSDFGKMKFGDTRLDPWGGICSGGAVVL